MAGSIFFQVNGEHHQVEPPGDLSLLAFLHDYLGLFGSKNGCNQGHCGSCTVIIDGRAKRACTVRVSGLMGSRIETIENLASEGQLHPLQTAFMSEGAVQCGFCTPGMIMAAKALLDINPNPTPDEIKDALRFNLCRCTGYAAIIRAVQLAAGMLRGEVSAAGSVAGESAVRPDEAVVGSSPVKKDALSKATGAPIYAGDLIFEHLLYGKLLLSRYPSARIININRQKALSAPGVVRVLTAEDIPGRKSFGLLNPHQPVMAADVVRYAGESLALVLAESEAQAAGALSLIEVEYEPLPGLFSAEDGLKDDAPLVHPEGNIMHHVAVRKGDIEKAFAEAAVIVEGEYTTPMVEHAYLEPEAAVARLEDDGVVSVWTASQGSAVFREMIAASLDLPLEKVRVIYTPAGGAFGGKEEPTVQIHCALGAMLTGRPVKMVLTRRESLIMSTKRHQTKMYYRHGAAADGKITAIEARVIVDAGAYDSLSKPVVFRTGIITAGPYDIPNVNTDSYGVYTNHPPGGAFRGFGTTQVAFGAEMQIDKLALALKMDPFELRKINGLAPGKTTITGQVIKSDCGFQQALAKVEQSLKEYIKLLPRPSDGKKIGIGVAGAYKNVGLGAGKNDQAGARIEIDRSGTLLLKVGAADMGQGSDTTMAQLAAQETGLPYEDFVVISNDTAQTPDGGVTTASRQTYISGYAVLGAAGEFNTVFQRCLEELFGLANGEYKTVHGGIETRDQEGHDKLITYRNLTLAAEKAGLALAGEYVYTAPLTYPLRERSDHEAAIPLENFDVHFAYCYAAQAVVVEVDETSGEVKVLKVIAAQDLGKAIHPQNSRCQIEGAILMGMGYGLSEEFVLKDGLMITDNLAKLKLLKITASPQMEIILVEEESGGPYGAKGMGELPLNPTAPAIINAINDAVGVRIYDLPATSEKILAALNKKRGMSKC
jgi:CO/xanthine dehydrogenase Mo-binding subunit/aerobic-type carbon monoxide dehydrogenase small subunit (CoxS/CutS family)